MVAVSILPDRRTRSKHSIPAVHDLLVAVPSLAALTPHHLAEATGCALFELLCTRQRGRSGVPARTRHPLRDAREKLDLLSRAYAARMTRGVAVLLPMASPRPPGNPHEMHVLCGSSGRAVISAHSVVDVSPFLPLCPRGDVGKWLG